MTAQRSERSERSVGRLVSPTRDAPPKQPPYLRNVPGKRAIPADPLTGQSLRSDGLFIRVSDERLDNPPARLDYADGNRADITACPIRLHTPQVEEGGLGGHAFARQFARYLASGLAQRRADAGAAMRFWWLDAYGRRRVLARFIRDDGPDAGKLAYGVALAISSRFLSYDEVSAETGQRAKWITEQTLRADRYACEPAIRVVRPITPRRDQRAQSA